MAKSFVPFLAGALEFEKTEEDLIEQIRTGLALGAFALWRIGPQGFCFAEILPTDVGSKVVMVHGAYLEKADPKTLGELDQAIETWARIYGAEGSVFYTRRKPEAFLRRLKKWKLDSYVLRRDYGPTSVSGPNGAG